MAGKAGAVAKWDWIDLGSHWPLPHSFSSLVAATVRELALAVWSPSCSQRMGLQRAALVTAVACRLAQRTLSLKNSLATSSVGPGLGPCLSLSQAQTPRTFQNSHV